MRDLRPVSYRALLLASVASMAFGGSAGAASYTAPPPITSAGPGVTLQTGDTLTNTNSSITATGASQPAVLVGSGASSIANSGLIQATGANGAGVQVMSGGSVNTITNSGTVQTTNGGNAILVGDTVGPAGSVGTITSSGLIQSSGTSSAILVEPGSSITSIVNSGTIQPGAGGGFGIDVAGTVGAISNSGLIQAGSGEVGIRVEGTVGSIGNAAGGTIQAIGNGNAIYVVGTAGAAGMVGTIANSGLIQSTGTNSAISLSGSGTVGSIINNAGGTIQATGTATAIYDGGTIGAIGNSGTIQVSADHDSAIYVSPTGSLTTLTNNAGGLIQATGTNDAAIRVDGTVGNINNNASATIQATALGNAIYVAGTAGLAGMVGTIANSGLMQSAGTDSAISLSGTATVGSIVNSAGGTIQATGTANAIYDGGTIGAISNSGTIQVSADNDVAIYVPSAGSLTTLTNNAGGLIQATGTNDAAIRVNNAIGSINNNAGATIQATALGNAIYVAGTAGLAGMVGTIANSGLMQSAGTDSAILLTGIGTVGSIVNNGGGTIQAAGTGSGIYDGGTIGAISNSGLIASNGASGVGIHVVSNGSVGTITNAAGGTIEANGSAGNAVTVAGVLTTISNSGLIASNGANGIGIHVVSGGSVGGITNNAGGVIQANGTNGVAMQVDASSSVGTISNAGTIQANGPQGQAVAILGSVTSLTNTQTGLIQANGTQGIGINVAGGLGTLANAGTIQATGTGGIAVLNSGTIGGIVNSGQILAPLGTAIAMGATAQITNGITNTATGLIQGGPSNGSGVAIDDSVGTHPLAITTAGTIIGQIKLGPAGDTLNVSGGSIIGNVIGQPGSNDILNFNPTGTFTTNGSIANVDTINVNSNVVALQNPVSSAIAFNVASGATTALNANVQATNFNNAGNVNIGGGTPTITGNYTQSSGATLGVIVTNAGTAGAGKLTVSGTATIQGGANAVSVHVPTATDVFGLTGTSWSVLTSGTLVANASSLTASSDNSAISFGLANTSTDLVLSSLGLTPGQIQTGAANDVTTLFLPLSGFASFSQIQAQDFLEQVFVGLASRGPTGQQLVHQINTILSKLSPGQLLQFNNQLLPSTLNDAALDMATTTNVLSGGEANISSRLTFARLNATQSGLAAGDEVGRGITFWGQPFGSLTSQDSRDGIEGYNAGTYGVTLGGDLLVTQNLRAGLAMTLSNSNINYNGSLSGNTGSIFTGELDLYGTWYQQNFFVDGLLSAAYSHYNRHNLLSALGVARDSDNGGTQLSVKIGAGYDAKLGNGAVLTPYGSVQQFHFNFGSYTTSGASAYGMDLHANSQTADITQTRLGARLAYPVKLRDGGSLAPEIHAYWLHDFGSNRLTTTYTTADVAGPNSFISVGPPADRDTFDIGVGATFAKGPQWSFGGGYDYAGRSTSSGHNFYVTLKVNF